MPNPPLNLQTSSILARFSREGDRFTHGIVQRATPGEADYILSVPGTSSEDWPSDPPVQQVVMEQLGSPLRTVAFGVGMTGPGHWSLAAEVVGPHADRIQFDWACRILRPAERIGSTYRAMSIPQLQRRQFTEPHAEWRLENGQSLILLVAGGKLVWSEQNLTLSIEPTSDIRTVGTHCWRYCFWVE